MTDPFAPAEPAEPTAPSGATVPCAACGAAVDPSAASYSAEGELICRRCEALETIGAGEQRAISGIVGGAIGAFACGILSLCFNPFLLISFMAIAGGVGTLVTLARHPEYKKPMGARYGIAMTGAIIGLVLGLAWPVLALLSLAGLLTMATLG
jgi:hypothetical protein